jgi:antitoxin Phd
MTRLTSQFIKEAVMGQWQLQDAKARFSELIKSAQEDGPQQVTVRGKPSAVVISVEGYEAMKRQRPRFVELLRASPLVGAEIEIVRSDSPVRDIAL